MDLSTFIQNHQPLLERYLLSSSPEAFLQNDLALPQERKLFDFLLNPLTDKERELIASFNLNPSERQTLFNSKAFRELETATNEEQRQTLIAKIKELYTGLYFDYPKPADVTNVGPSAVAGQEAEKKAAVKFETEATVEQVVARALKENPANFSQLSNYGLKNLPLSVLQELKDESSIQFLMSKQEVLRSLDAKAVAQFFSRMLEQAMRDKHTSEEEEFPAELFSMLGFEQLEALRELKPKLFDSYQYHLQLFRLKYQHKFEQFQPIAALSFQQRAQKKELCLAALAELRESGKDFYENLIEKLTEEVLLIDEANVDSNLDLFLEYLGSLKSFNYENLDSTFRNARREEFGRNKYLSRSYPTLEFLESAGIDQSTLINATIVSLFKADNPATLDKLAPFISRKYLVKEQAKVRLSQGKQKELTGLQEIFSAGELTELKEQREITFLPSNKKNFGLKDAVKLDVRVKNVKKLTKKVYTIDLEKQLLQSGANIDQNINLKFLVPESQQEIQTKDTADAFEEVKFTVEFPELEGKLGEFIVELEGEGISSRAIIRRGKIILENKPTAIGHELTFFDGEGHLIPELVIWRDSKRVEVKDRYFIPYGPQGSEQIIAVSNGHAEQLSVAINNEQYAFTCDYLYHTESFIVGNKARIILHPSLTLNAKPASLARLQKLAITLTAVNNQNITSTQLIENVAFKDSEDYVIEYPVKAYLKALQIAVTGEVELISKEITKIAHSGSVAIDLEEGTENLMDLYLERSYEGDYRLKVRGKNGEPIPCAGVILSYEQFGVNFCFTKELVADEAGEVGLGRLAQVVKLTVQATHNSFTSVRSWPLNNFGESVSYGGNLYSCAYKVTLRQGDSYSLPLPCQLHLSSDVIFQKSDSNQQVFYNRLSDVKLSKDRLTLEGLDVGEYTLVLLRLNRRVDIKVIQGKEWIGGRIITDKNVAHKLSHKPQNLLGLGDITAELKEDQVEYSIDILSAAETLPSDLRVHVFAKNYIDSETPAALRCERRVCIPRPDEEYVEFRQSSYFSNKRLSDETAYVLNRRTQDVTNGNNLEKPHIFLKRIEVRATSEKDEELRAEGMFEKERSYERMAMKCAAPRGYRMADDCFAFGSSAPHLGFSSSVRLNRGLNSHNNFLHRVGHLSPNLKKVHSIHVPKGYSHLLVYLFSGENVVKREYSLPDGRVELLRLTHKALVDADKKSGWTMSREIYPVQAGQQKEISRSSTWTTVALASVAEYAKIQGVALPDWVTAWRNYSPEKKLEVYDKEVCHELNFFLSRNDAPFFQAVVRPFISNKVTKTFIDHYLLDDQEELLKSSSTHKLAKLNYFERAILVEKLKAYGRDKEADSLASALELPLKGIKKSNEEFKQFFETVLNAKKDLPPPPPPSAPMAAGFAFGGAMQSASFAFAPPPAYAAQQIQMRMQMDMCEDECYEMQRCCDVAMVEEAKESYKPGFKETEKTKEYTETTYSGLTNPDQSASLVPLSHFWAELARHFASGSASPFLSDKFSHLSQRVEFVLACSVLANDAQAEYELSNHENGHRITAKNSFLVFVREVKSLPFEESKNVVLNQRFFDPKNRYRVDEEGTQVEREVESFLVLKPYTLQTLLTNISGSNLEIQLLQDIPEGAIPLLSHEQTQITNVSLPAYNTKSFERVFYFPEEGSYAFYPANASRGRAIIAKSAPTGALRVARREEGGKLETLDNILRSGTQANILEFLATRNIFDPKVFNFALIMWKLKDKDFFLKVVAILKERRLYEHSVWSFAFFHGEFELVREYLANGPNLGQALLTLPIFEYYPYYSRRAHKFADENKSTIRVQELKDNYARFLFNAVFSGATQHPHFTLTLIYYLLLQDRVAEVRTLFAKVTQQDRARFALQYDYIACFLDIYDGAASDYAVAREISARYREYPVAAWRKLFLDVYNTLERGQEEESEETRAEEVAFATSVVNAGAEVRISRPAQVRVVANLYEIDIQLYFSEFPFADLAQFSAIKPKRTEVFEGPEFRVERLTRAGYADLRNIFVEIYEQRGSSALTKISSFFWSNPEVRVKINEREGTLKVFHGGKKCTTSYVKVYSRGSKGQKFARDGYTDVASTFRYALDVKDITEFAILVLTDFGGSIHKVQPPSLY